VLLAAAALAVVMFPFRATWWGGWLLAVAEAGVVGGLAWPSASPTSSGWSTAPAW
jgi:uncharacterized membrane-anchored protein YjiN (DUF445 family)